MPMIHQACEKKRKVSKKRALFKKNVDYSSDSEDEKIPPAIKLLKKSIQFSILVAVVEDLLQENINNLKCTQTSTPPVSCSGKR